MEEKITCSSGKPCFKTQAGIKEYIKKRNQICGGISFRYYYCKECGCYHLTSNIVSGEQMLRKHAKKYDREYERETLNFYRALYGI